MDLIFNEFTVAFPWYDKLEKQYRYKENAEKICDYKLISPSNSLLPFQFRRVAQLGNPPVSWVIKEINSNTTVKDLSINLPDISGASQLRIRTVEGYDYFLFNGNGTLKVDDENFYDIPLDYGFYYSVITFQDGTKQYSEMFHVPDPSFKIAGPGSEPTEQLQIDDISKMKYLRFIWNNNCDLKPVYYQEMQDDAPYWRQCIYLDSFITNSEPEITTDGPKDGQDEQIPTFQKVVVKYRITDMVPDYLKVALFLMQMHDNVNLTEAKGVRRGDLKSFTVNSSVEFNGALSQVDILFQQDLLQVKAGCCENFISPDTDCDTFDVTLEMTPLVDPDDTDDVTDFYTVSGTGRPEGWFEFFASIDGTTWVFVRAISYADYISGIDIHTGNDGYHQFKVVNKNFNCIFGTSDVVEF